MGLLVIYTNSYLPNLRLLPSTKLKQVCVPTFVKSEATSPRPQTLDYKTTPSLLLPHPKPIPVSTSVPFMLWFTS